MSFPEPVIGIAIEPKTQADLDKMGAALAKLAEEDPTFKVHTDEETGQTVISGMGELAPGDPRGPHEARVQGGMQPGRAPGEVQGGHHGHPWNTASCTRSRPVVAVSSPTSTCASSHRPILRRPAWSSSTRSRVVAIPKEFIGPVQKGFEVP
jgi:hypothetical protein